MLWLSAQYLQFVNCGISFGTSLQLHQRGFAREGSPMLVSFYSTAGFTGEADGEQRWSAIYEVLRHSLGGIVVDAGSDVSALGFVLALGHDVHAMARLTSCSLVYCAARSTALKRVIGARGRAPRAVDATRMCEQGGEQAEAACHATVERHDGSARTALRQN